MKKLMSILGGLCLLSVALADYSYQNGSVCVGDVCSIETCNVTEYGPEEVTTTETLSCGDTVIDLHTYLLAQGETEFAEWLLSTTQSCSCMIDCQYEQETTVITTPDPTEVCTWTDPICGNGVVDTPEGEECDEGIAVNGTEGSGCDADCKVQPYCGDAVVNAELGEECDPGYDAEYCDEVTCLYLEDVPREFDIEIRDPVPCEGHFNGGIVSEDTDYSTMWMYLEAKCPGSDEYVPLNPEIDEFGEYLAEIEYTDLTSPRFLVGQCHIRYGGGFKDSDFIVHKTQYEYLEGICRTGGGGGGSGPYGPTSTSGGSGGPRGPFPAEPSYSSFYEVVEGEEVFHNAAPIGSAPLELYPGVPLNFPAELVETGGYLW